MIRLIKKLFRAGFMLALLALIIYVYMHYVEPKSLQIVRLDEQSPKINGEMKAVAFGDVHIGRGNDAVELEKLVQKINAENPDVVFFLGDFFDNYKTYQGDCDALTAALLGIEAEYKIAVTGNHDIGGGAQFVFPGFIRGAGFTLLENENLMLDEWGINIVGSVDALYFTPDVAGLSGEGYDILLVHEPDAGEDLSGFEYQISGHSHGGQIYIPLITQRILPEGSRTYYRGEYQKSDGKIYVNRGIGMSIAEFRLFSRPELTVITFSE